MNTDGKKNTTYISLSYVDNIHNILQKHCKILQFKLQFLYDILLLSNIIYLSRSQENWLLFFLHGIQSCNEIKDFTTLVNARKNNICNLGFMNNPKF